MIKKLPGRLRILAATFFTLGFSAAVVLPSYGADQAARNPSRIVAVGGSVTEIVYALGEEERLVARDSTSTYPSAAEQDLPDIGYMRALSAEGVLSVSPDMLLILDGSGPPETLDLLEKTGIAITKVPEQHSGDGRSQNAELIDGYEQWGKRQG